VSAERAPSAPRPPDENKQEQRFWSRDGHRDEVQNYAIVGQALWVLTQQRARKIPVADLGKKTTKETNADRGVEFRLSRSGDSCLRGCTPLCVVLT